MESTIQVRQRGTLTLPAELRTKYGIEPGDTFGLVDLDGIFVLTPMVTMVPDPALADLRLYAGLAEAADLPIWVAALRKGCPWLVTFNVRHYQPGHPDVVVLRSGEFIRLVRDRLARL